MAIIYNKVINQMDNRSGYGNSAARFRETAAAHSEQGRTSGLRARFPALETVPNPTRSIIDTILATNFQTTTRITSKREHEMKNGITYLLLALAAAWLFVACGSKTAKEPLRTISTYSSNFRHRSMSLKAGNTPLEVITEEGEIALTTDSFLLESDAGISYVCPIVKTSS